MASSTSLKSLGLAGIVDLIGLRLEHFHERACPALDAGWNSVFPSENATMQEGWSGSAGGSDRFSILA
jgi:hypothetical protein